MEEKDHENNGENRISILSVDSSQLSSDSEKDGPDFAAIEANTNCSKAFSAAKEIYTTEKTYNEVNISAPKIIKLLKYSKIF